MLTASRDNLEATPSHSDEQDGEQDEVEDDFDLRLVNLLLLLKMRCNQTCGERTDNQHPCWNMRNALI